MINVYNYYIHNWNMKHILLIYKKIRFNIKLSYILHRRWYKVAWYMWGAHHSNRMGLKTKDVQQTYKNQLMLKDINPKNCLPRELYQHVRTISNFEVSNVWLLINASVLPGDCSIALQSNYKTARWSEFTGRGVWLPSNGPTPQICSVTLACLYRYLKLCRWGH